MSETDPDPTAVLPRPLVLNGLPTPYGLRRIARAAGDRFATREEAAGLLALADRLPALLAAEAEAAKWKAVVARIEPIGTLGGVRCLACGANGYPHLTRHAPDCAHVAARGGA